MAWVSPHTDRGLAPDVESAGRTKTAYLTTTPMIVTMRHDGRSIPIGSEIEVLYSTMADTSQVYLAVDLGASSGRVAAGLFDGRRLQLEEVHRFENGGVLAAGRLHWDVLFLWREIREGLNAAAARYGDRIAALGVDAWGVDFALLGDHDELLGNPYHYRDSRTKDMFEEAFARVSREEVFAATGLQFMEINTLYQLLAMRRSRSPLLSAAKSFLMIPDLFHWLLTGEKANEMTDASTTQFYNPQTGDWAWGLLEKLDLPTQILQRIARPGETLGPLRKEEAQQTGLTQAKVVLPGSHDTASAVMATPVNANGSWCYISSGTWSLMGVEVAQPILNDKCRQLNFTNEGGVGGTTRVLKNIAGLWLVQECHRIWKQRGHDWTWEDLVRMAEKSPPLACFIDPDDPSFVAPQNMPSAIGEFCGRTNQTPPDSPGAVVRCALESLAMRYRRVLGWLEELTGRHIETIHIIGGGVQNTLLCQMTADATNRPVIAGPIEATAIGNLMMQAIACGAVSNIAQARGLTSASFPVQYYRPQNTTPWDEAYQDRALRILDHQSTS